MERRHKLRTAKAELPDGDFLHRDIPKIVLPEPVHLCPLCALKLDGNEARCPRCGVPLSQLPQRLEEMLECPECGALAPVGAKRCSKCGVGFEEIVPMPSAPPVKELPPPPMPAKPEHVPERRVPEIAPMTAAPSQMPSSQGLVNGRGAINGTGLTNGTGMVNGTKGVAVLPRESRQRGFVRRWQFLAILVAIVVIVPTFIFLSYSNEPSPFAVDGNFHEWSGVEVFGAQVTAGADSIDLNEWAVQPEDDGLFVYLMTKGVLWPSTDVCSFYLFVDSDNSPSTGYSVSGIGADYLIEFDGWNGSVQSATASQYVVSSGDALNWNSWHLLGSIDAISSGRQLEAFASTLTTATISSNSRFLLVSQDSLEQKSVSYPVPAKGGLLVIKQEPGPAVGPTGIVAQSSGSALVRLRLTCEGADGTLNSIASGFSNVPLATVIDDVDLSIGVEEVIDIMFDTSGSPPESMVTADLSKALIDSTFADVEIIGDPISAYVGAVPSSIVIDGAFGDWTGRITADSDSFPNSNPNIDITAVGAVNDSDASYFYVSVLDGMCNGSFIPVLREIPSGGGGGGGGTLPRMTGEDILNIYIDTDLSSATGYAISLGSKIIGADYKIQIKGFNGDIISRSLYHFESGLWSPSPGAIEAKKDLRRMEVGVSATSLGDSSTIDFIIETTDWRSRTDLATSVPKGTRAMVGGLAAGGSFDSWAIDSSISGTATAMSYQRKLFFDGTNLWSFYFDGTNTVYKYSTDGTIWVPGGRAFTTNGVEESSIWYVQSSNSLYIIGDVATSSSTVVVRNGTVSPSTHSISWSSESVPTVSTIGLGGKNTYITRDASGYIWLLTSNCTRTTLTQYELTAFRSRDAGSISSFFATGSMIGGLGSPQPTIKGSIVNVGSGSDMLAVYGYAGSVIARVYTSSAWGLATTVYAIGTGNPGNTENAPPCVVVDGKGVAHVVYGDGHKQSLVSKPYIYYVYYNGAWSTPLRLDSVANNIGNVYPTISLDRSTGNLFAFWIQTDNSGAGYSLMAKKNTTGTWTFYSLTSGTTYVKSYLTSIYSAQSENAICWQWTQNTTSPYEVQFDRIPEFQDAAVPIMVMMCIFVVLAIRRRRESRSS